ncbi:phage terminase large subunit [Sphingobium sp. KCTC 72723]|uniref:phage terminase large subunit n=1 Tax=Sphingobium sp. KCTC 72723 TaxID=2733867 RepID=UPI00165E9E2A|nr:phage terminase large subunit [Sphingobium sp. KCTC 72723]
MAPKSIHITPQLTLNCDQLALLRKINTPAYDYVLGYGGGGSGKSLVIQLAIINRAMNAAGSRHGIYRDTRNNCQQTLFDKTLKEVLDLAYPGLEAKLKINASELTVTFPNGSVMLYNGLDDDRLLKVRGQEFQTVWFNECNAFNYTQVSALMSRLRSPKKYDNGAMMHNLFVADCNPRSKQDWEYKAFILGMNPTDGNALEDHHRWSAMKLFPQNNLDVLGEDYLRRQAASMTAADRKSLIDGDWADDNPDAIFTAAMIDAERITKPSSYTIKQTLALPELAGIRRIIVAVDPAVTNHKNSDLSGIIVAALLDNGKVAILADHTMKGTPDAVSQKVVDLMADWGATRVVIEKNQGGNWLEANIRKFFPNIDIKPVDATSRTGGKASRAEPVSAQYERGMIRHVGALPELEEQMCEFGMKGVTKSPDRLDAMVWAVWHLMDLANAVRPSGMSIVPVTGHWR